MPDLKLLKNFFMEILPGKLPNRTPEPFLVMNDPSQVDAFKKAGLESGPMAPTYLFHTLQLLEMIRPNDQVIDLACGPANQLCQVARLNPEAHFVGIDLSENMLKQARENVARQGLKNVELKMGDMSSLDQFGLCSVDQVISTMSLHHLPEEDKLFECFREIARVLKPTGGIYLADFARMKRESTLQFFAYHDSEQHPPAYTTDFLNSLRAAFPIKKMKEALNYLPCKNNPILYQTFMVPFMFVIKTKARNNPSQDQIASINKMIEIMKPNQKMNFDNLRQFFKAGGLDSKIFRSTS
jgi:arsenite methyltransferase